jgi:putative holliday junction resolvase
MMRAIGLDLGTRRIGVALSDSAGRVATPHDVLTRSSDRERDHSRIAELVDEAGAEVVVVGLPLSLDGSVGPAARGVLDEADELRARVAVGVKGRRGRRVVDQVAATVILQSWLDAGQPRP